jgi:predicted MFS family arabinose efflux permease
VAAAVLLVAFGFIEVRSRHALMPIRVLRSRDRTGAYLISLCIGTALFGMFFFLTLFVQNVWGYSPIKSGVAYLPMVAMMILGSGLASQLVPRIGARPLIIAGAALSAGGMFWVAQLNEHSSYAGGMLGPTMVTALGLGLIFVPMSLVALVRVANNDAGVASSLFNVGQQVGGSIGLGVLGTVAWSAVASNLRSAGAAAAHAPAAHLSKAQELAAQTAMTNHALAYGFSRGFLVSAGVMLLGLVIGLVAIRVTRKDLAGIDPMAAPAG